MNCNTLIFGTSLLLFAATTATAETGEALFKKHCAVCHPDGGNIINANKTLKASDLKKNGVKGAAGIVKSMRTPGTGMTKFDKKTISDKDAKAIAAYILKAFK